MVKTNEVKYDAFTVPSDKDANLLWSSHEAATPELQRTSCSLFKLPEVHNDTHNTETLQL